MKSRPEPSPAPVTYTGLCRPEAILVNLNEFLSGLGPLGVASAGVDDGLGAGVESDGVGVLAPGDDCEVGLEPLHPVRNTVARQTADSQRTLQEV